MEKLEKTNMASVRRALSTLSLTLEALQSLTPSAYFPLSLSFIRQREKRHAGPICMSMPPHPEAPHCASKIN